MTPLRARSELEQLVHDLIERTKGPVQQALKDASISARDIDEVVLVGGQTRMPAIQLIVKDLFGKEPHRGVNPDEVVAVGAAIRRQDVGSAPLGGWGNRIRVSSASGVCRAPRELRAHGAYPSKAYTAVRRLRDGVWRAMPQTEGKAARKQTRGAQPRFVRRTT